MAHQERDTSTDEPQLEEPAEREANAREEMAAAEPEQAEDLPPLDEAEALRVERDALREQLLRRAAEYENFRKRTAREWQQQRERAASEVLRAMLEISDNLDRALDSAETDAEGLRKGVELIHQQLHAELKRFGVEPIEAAGKPFDPTEHEAVLMVDSEEVEAQHVVDVVQPGYTLHGMVLRPARVTVARDATDA
jgi:molecular chaperone GrpE